jgi:hypothetical protein
MSRDLIILAGVAIILAIIAISNRPPVEEPIGIEKQHEEDIHLHAGFQVYKDNKLIDYSGFEFMKVEPCSLETHSEELDLEHEQLEKAHLHDSVGDVVHVHREGAAWGDLFANIKVEVSAKEVYLNGGLYEGDIMAYKIMPYDSVVIFDGENTDIENKLQNEVTKEHIIEVENTSENCAG